MLKRKIKSGKKVKNDTKISKIEDDEEIASVSSVDSKEVERKHKKDLPLNEKNILQKEFSKAMSADERKLLMAKTLIAQVGGDDKLDDELEKSKNEHCSEISKFFNKSDDFTFIKCHLSGITSITYLDESKIITTSKDKRAFLIDIESEKKTLLPEFCQKSLYSAAICKDKKSVLFGGSDRKIYNFCLETNKINSVYPKAHYDTITNIKIDPDNEQVYTTSKDNNLKVWALNSFNNIVYMETFFGHINHINDIDLLSSNKVITCGEDSNVHQWKIDTQSFLQYKQGDSSYDCINGINKNYFFTGDYSGGLKLFSINKKKQINEFKSDTPICSMFSFKNTDLIFTGTIGGKVNVFNSNYNKGSKINLLSSFCLLNNGIVSSICGFKGNLVLGYSKDAKNGRWDTDYSLKKEGIAIVKILDN